MLYYAKFVERASRDPQESRALAEVRARSIDWLKSIQNDECVVYLFRGEENNTTHFFLDSQSHASLHELLDADPLSMHCNVEIEPLLTTVEMAQALQQYLGRTILSDQDWHELEFPKKSIDALGSYYLARKVVAPFSPLLDITAQNIIHHNTLISQSAHIDEREVADFNPVAKPVGILIMRAESKEEVLSHVRSCQVYVDSQVYIERLLTIHQAEAENALCLNKYLVGGFQRN